MMKAETLPWPADSLRVGAFRPNSRKNTAGMTRAKITVRRLRSRRRISRPSTVRLMPPRPGASGPELGRGAGVLIGPPGWLPSSLVRAMKASSRPRAVISRSCAPVSVSRYLATLSLSLGVDQDGVAADLDAVGRGDVPQPRLVGTGQRGPHGPAGGQGLHLRAGAVGDDLALAQQDDPVRVGIGLLQVVRREQHGPPLLGVLPDGAPELAPALDVHAGGRLVQDQQVGVGQQRHRESQPLLLAARALADQPVRDRGDPGPAQDLAAGRCALGEQAGGVPGGLGHGEVLEQPAGLHDRRDQAALDRLPRVMPVPRPGRRRLRQAEDHVDRGGLARAVRPEQRHDLARRDGQVNVTHGLDMTKVLADVL